MVETVESRSFGGEIYTRAVRWADSMGQLPDPNYPIGTVYKAIQRLTTDSSPNGTPTGVERLDRHQLMVVHEAEAAMPSTELPSRAAQVRDDRQYATVVVGCGEQAELGEDAGDVGLDGSGAEDQPVTDGLVGPSLGHEREHFALTRCEVGETVLSPASS